MPNEENHNYKKFAILYVDDDIKCLDAFTKAFVNDFQILTATNATQALEILKRSGDQIGVLLTDQRMPGEKGIWLIEKCREIKPQIVRLLITAYADFDAMIVALNTGQIFKYITKPYDPAVLAVTLKESLQKFMSETKPPVITEPPFEAYFGENEYIFVSYSHKDAPLVYPELDRLHRLGFRIWFDEGIDPGNEWPEEVAKALDQSSLFLVFVSPRSVESQNVRNEINFALNNKKSFLALYIEETALPRGLALRMGDIQAVFQHRMSKDRYLRQMDKVLPQSLKSPIREKLQTD